MGFLTFSIFSILINASAIAQEDTVKTDSTQLYKNIETFSKGSRFKTFLYRLVFKPVTIISKKEIKKSEYKKLIQKPYSTFQGKIIRKIDITTLDPFGYSATDTNVKSLNILTKSGNSLHIKTQQLAIRNLLLFRENEPFNSSFVKESERLIRGEKFVHDVYFYVASPNKKSDSVDITIRELDIWSIHPSLSITTSVLKTGLTDRNFLGSGHEFQNFYIRNFDTGINYFNTYYIIPNIKTTYINSRLHYGIDGYGNIRRSIAFDRPFYSPYTKWAAGILLGSRIARDSVEYEDPLHVPLNLKYNTQDIWGAKAFQIFKSPENEDLVTNFILTSRYLRVRFRETPADINDPLNIFANEDFLMASIGISARRYVQDKFIFKYGLVEDVPVGKVYELTGGYQIRNNVHRPYLGVRVSSGNYYDWGYLSFDFRYGTFFKSSETEQGVVMAGLNYFTGLMEAGRWKFRQFIKPEITIGINRFSYDSLTLNNEYGLDGFNSTTISGTNRLLLTLQTQSYAPWDVLGFNFGPYFTCTLGMVGDAVNGFKNRKLYSLLGVGVLIKNEHLVINTFQVSISFYPLIPGRGNNIFKFNSYRTGEFGFRDFEIGKPAPVLYR